MGAIPSSATSTEQIATPVSATGTRPKRSTAPPAARPSTIPATPKPGEQEPARDRVQPELVGGEHGDQEADAGHARVARERGAAEQADAAGEHGAQPRDVVAAAPVGRRHRRQRDRHHAPG